MIRNIVITGCAGFIGSHLADRLLKSDAIIAGIDNLRRGSLNNLLCASKDSRFQFVSADLSINTECERAFEAAQSRGPIDVVWHMAANSDIGAGGRRCVSGSARHISYYLQYASSDAHPY